MNYSFFKYITLPKEVREQAAKTVSKVLFWVVTSLRFIFILIKGRQCRVYYFSFDNCYRIFGCPSALQWQIKNSYLLHISPEVGFISPKAKGVVLNSTIKEKYTLTAYGIQGKIIISAKDILHEVTITNSPILNHTPLVKCSGAVIWQFISNKEAAIKYAPLSFPSSRNMKKIHRIPTIITPHFAIKDLKT